MRRLFWIGVGATVAVVVVVKGRQLVHRFTPEGVGEEIEGQVKSLAARASEAVATFSAAAAERERELTEALLGQRDVEEAREMRRERKARKAWDFDDAPADTDDDDALGYSFF